MKNTNPNLYYVVGWDMTGSTFADIVAYSADEAREIALYDDDFVDIDRVVYVGKCNDKNVYDN